MGGDEDDGCGWLKRMGAKGRKWSDSRGKGRAIQAF